LGGAGLVAFFEAVRERERRRIAVVVACMMLQVVMVDYSGGTS